MEFRLLGLFEVREDGRAVELPRGKERALLTVLLLHADEPVSTDRLVEELWEERPPANAAKTVQVYVSRLRKSVGATRLRTTPAGYALQVGPDELDSLVFERLARDGREALADSDPKTAQRLLSEALALWRGPALADFRFESFAQPEVRRLEELRAAAAADLIDARLARGEVDAVIGELEALVEEHALWERPRGQLMLALYRAGRQADALELYRKTRALFAEELGIEPSPELQALERAILNQDETLSAPEPPARRAVARRGSRLLLAGGLLLVAAAATAAVLVATRGGSSRISSLAPDSIGVIDAASLRITTQLSLSGRPTRLGADGGSVWVGGDEAGTLSAVEAANGSVSGVVATSGFPSDVAVGEGAVWVVDGESGLLRKVDPAYRSVARRIRVAPRNLTYDRSRESPDPTAVAAGLASVWTTDGSKWLTRLDPKTLKVVDRIDLGSPLGDVAVGDGAIWAISGAAATVFRLDRDGGVTWRIPIASKPDAESPYPIGVAAGAGLVWVLNANTATVTKIEPAQRLVAATIQLEVERRPVRLAAGDGAVWVADGDGTLARIDATTDQVEIVPAAGSLRDVAVVGKTIWVTAGAGPGGVAKNVAANASAGRVRALPQSSCSPISYESGTRPQYLIVGDLTLQGSGSALVSQTAEAIQFILKQHRFHAGRYVVGYQSCDNSTIANGGPLPAKCAANARAYVADSSVIGIIGASSSGCSQVELPIANRAPDGPLAMVAPGNTYVGLTHHGPGTSPDEPAKYYPAGTRSYVRLMAADDVQGAADALAARRLGARRVYVLEDTTSYSSGIAADFARAARRLGLTVVGPSVWNYEAKSYTPFVTRVARSHPDAVFLGTFYSPEGVRLIKDLRSALPAGALLMAPDGFDPSDLVTYAGAAAEGMTASVAGRPAKQLPARGRRFVEDFEHATGNTPPTVYSIAAAQATEVLLDAIARSDGTRASVVKQLFRTRVTNGILGTFGFDRNGDTTAGAVTVYRITHGSPRIFEVITPPPALMR